MRWIFLLLGVVVRPHPESPDWSSDKGKVLISNHISPLDPLVVHLLTGCRTVNSFQLTDWLLCLPDKTQIIISLQPSSPCPTWLQHTMGIKYFSDRSPHHALNAVRQGSSENGGSGVPVLIFPEGTTTNGRVGLLQ